MIARFDQLWQQARPAFSQQRSWQRARTLALSGLACLGRRTLSGVLCASAQQFRDWSAAYRLFERERFEAQRLFEPPCAVWTQATAQANQPLVAAMDDTLLRKRGRKVYGASWKHDPLGPAYRPQLAWAQRFVQISAMLPEAPAGGARAIPIDFYHAALPQRPGRRADEHHWALYEQQRREARISVIGARRLHALRQTLDEQPAARQRQLIVSLDGSYTNRTVWSQIDPRTTLIGRVRKDSRLFAVPEPSPSPARGRKRFYGQALPTPEQLRQDASIPWQKIDAYAAGKQHTFEIKTLEAVRWKGAGARTLRLILIRPLAYRPTAHARLLYRNPAYLLCSDPQLSVQTALQAYLWRWEIEVNFREEKTLLGLGEAQVRTEAAVAAVPALQVASYAYLLLAAQQLQQPLQCLPLPKWRTQTPNRRTSSAQLLGRLRAELWGKALGIGNLSHFDKTSTTTQSHFYSNKPLASAVCYAFR